MEQRRAGAAEGQQSILHALTAYPAYRLLFSTTVATNAAFWMWNMATGWLALVLTDSAFFVGLASFLAGIPILLFALPAGTLIDRADRRKVLLAAQIAVAVVSSIVVLLLLLDLLEPWHLLVAVFLNGTAMSFVFPTRNALIANLVPPADLGNAVGLNATGQNLARIAGPTLAGPLLAAVGISATFVICTLVQILALTFTLRLPAVPPAPSGSRPSLLGGIAEGLTVIRRSSYLTGMMILAFVPTMFLLPYQNFLPVFARDVLEIGSGGLGVLLAVNGVGAVIGSLAVAGSRRLTRRADALLWSTILLGLSVIAFAASGSAPLAGLMILLAGLLSSFYSALNNYHIQMGVDDRVRGRVLSVYFLSWGVLPVGTLPLGAAADAYGAPAAVGVMAAIGLALIALAALYFPVLRRAGQADFQPDALA